MKKRFLSVILALSVLISLSSTAFAANTPETVLFDAENYVVIPRWSYVSSITPTLRFTSDGIKWAGSVIAYDVPSVTDTEITAKLAVMTAIGWGVVDSDTDKQPGTLAGVGGYFTGYHSGQSYRLEITVKVYNNSKVIESLGPFYSYLDT